LSKVIGSVALVAAAGFGSATPAQAQGFFDLLFGGHRGYHHVAPPPWVPRFDYRPMPRKRAVPKPKAQAAKPEAPKKPPDPATRPNPLVTLLRDPTLRNGDIVVFPDGPRVFRGGSGSQHALSDFVKLTSKDISRSARKTLSGIQVGENNAWSSEVGTTGKVAQSAPEAEVETTGSVRKERSPR